MVFQTLKLLLKASKLPVIIVACLLYTSNMSAAEKNLLALSRANISGYIESLQFDENHRYNVSQLYLLNRKLSKSEDTQKNGAILNRLEKIADWSIKPIVTVERINVYLKKRDKLQLSNFLVGLAKSPEVSLYEEKIFNVLVEAYAVNPEPIEIRRVLKQLLPALNWWRQDSRFIIWALGYLNVNDAEYASLIKQLWAITDVMTFPALYNPYLTKLKKNPANAHEIVADHFTKQYQIKNWSYIIAEAPYYLSRLPHVSAGFSKIRGIYIKTFFRKRQYSQLIQQLNSSKQIRLLSFTDEEKAALLFRLWLKKGWASKAAEYLNLLEKTASAKELADKYFEMAEFYYQKAQFKKSLGYFNRVKFGTAREHLVPVVQWRKLRIFEELKQPQEMAKIAIWADSYLFQSREIAAKFCYWGVKLKLYGKPRALTCYQQYPHTYYGFRSLQMGATYAGVEKTVLTNLKKGNKGRLSQLEHSFLGFVHVLYLTDETALADALVMRYLKKRISPPFFAHMAAVLYQAERFYLQQLLIDLYFKEYLYNGNSSQSQLLMAYYPAGYRGEVARHAGQSKMSPMLVYAVIREESNFRAEVESPAGAVGLMQLMPSTAKYIAKIKRMKYEPDHLIDPDINVKLGVAYLNRLLKRYKGNLFYTLAAYNGGATNVKRWIRITGARDLDVFVESITFIETQNYVKRVLRSYYIYQMLYD
jgi:soluble lytic murein transglycosylase-like protein